MKISRIRLLFPATIPADIANRQITILGACCWAAKKKMAASFLDTRLTGYSSRFSIDDVYQELGYHHGSPMRPTWKRSHSIQEVIATLYELHEQNLIGFDLKDFDDIRLTDELFRAIALEWAYTRGAKPFQIVGERIYARSVEVATAIGEKRTARLARLKRKEGQYA